MRRNLIAFVASLVLLGSGGCAALIGRQRLERARPGATTFHTVGVDGRERSFLLHLPPAAATGRRLPLVLVLHGFMGNGNAIMESSQMNDAADRMGVVVAYPNGTSRFSRYAFLGWNAVTCCGSATGRGVHDVAFLDTLVARLVSYGWVDPHRIYAAGFSAGGMLALRMACTPGSPVRAVADIAGAMPDTTCEPGRHVSVLFMQGEDDEDLRYDHRVLPRVHGHRFAHSFEEALRFWQARDGCSRVLLRDSTPDWMHERALRCPAGTAVELYTIRHHPHAWPGGVKNWFLSPEPAHALDGSRVVLDFFLTGDAAEGGR